MNRVPRLGCPSRSPRSSGAGRFRRAQAAASTKCPLQIREHAYVQRATCRRTRFALPPDEACAVAFDVSVQSSGPFPLRLAIPVLRARIQSTEPVDRFCADDGRRVGREHGDVDRGRGVGSTSWRSASRRSSCCRSSRASWPTPNGRRKRRGRGGLSRKRRTVVAENVFKIRRRELRLLSWRRSGKCRVQKTTKNGVSNSVVLVSVFQEISVVSVLSFLSE